MPPSLGVLEPRLVHANFNIGMEASLTASRVLDLAIQTKSSQSAEEQAVVSTTPQIIESPDGALVITELDGHTQTIRNRIFQRAMKIKRTELERSADAEKLIRDSLQGFGGRAGLMKGRIVADLMVNGAAATSLSYDGKKFYSAVGDPHPNGNGPSYINDLAVGQVPGLAVTLAAITVEQITRAILGVIGYMKTYTDDEGAPVNQMVTEWIIDLPNAYWVVAHLAAKQQRLDLGSSNVFLDEARGEINILDAQNAKITIRANELVPSFQGMWVHAVDRYSKPFVLQEEIPLELDWLDRANAAEYWVIQNGMLVRAYWRGGGGYANPRKSARATFSAA